MNDQKYKKKVENNLISLVVLTVCYVLCIVLAFFHRSPTAIVVLILSGLVLAGFWIAFLVKRSNKNKQTATKNSFPSKGIADDAEGNGLKTAAMELPRSEKGYPNTVMSDYPSLGGGCEQSAQDQTPGAQAPKDTEPVLDSQRAMPGHRPSYCEQCLRWLISEEVEEGTVDGKHYCLLCAAKLRGEDLDKIYAMPRYSHLNPRKTFISYDYEFLKECEDSRQNDDAKRNGSGDGSNASKEKSVSGKRGPRLQVDAAITERLTMEQAGKLFRDSVPDKHPYALTVTIDDSQLVAQTGPESETLARIRDGFVIESRVVPDHANPFFSIEYFEMEDEAVQKWLGHVSHVCGNQSLLERIQQLPYSKPNRSDMPYGHVVSTENSIIPIAETEGFSAVSLVHGTAYEFIYARLKRDSDGQYTRLSVRRVGSHFMIRVEKEFDTGGRCSQTKQIPEQWLKMEWPVFCCCFQKSFGDCVQTEQLESNHTWKRFLGF